MEHPAWQLPTVHVAPGPHSSMLHPPTTHVPILQLALAPLQVRPQPEPHEVISQVSPALQVWMSHPPEVHSASRQWALSPLHSIEQAPLQLSMVQLAP